MTAAYYYILPPRYTLPCALCGWRLVLAPLPTSNLTGLPFPSILSLLSPLPCDSNSQALRSGTFPLPCHRGRHGRRTPVLFSPVQAHLERRYHKPIVPHIGILYLLTRLLYGYATSHNLSIITAQHIITFPYQNSLYVRYLLLISNCCFIAVLVFSKEPAV